MLNFFINSFISIPRKDFPSLAANSTRKTVEWSVDRINQAWFRFADTRYRLPASDKELIRSLLVKALGANVPGDMFNRDVNMSKGYT